nr:hypothetical protein Q903MT_gene6467 [Picea sitchensis]
MLCPRKQARAINIKVKKVCEPVGLSRVVKTHATTCSSRADFTWAKERPVKVFYGISIFGIEGFFQILREW